MKYDLTREQALELRDWHTEAAVIAANERNYIAARDHQEQAEALSDALSKEPAPDGNLRELANCLMTIARDHPCASQALGIVSTCADHLRAVACCLDAAKKEVQQEDPRVLDARAERDHRGGALGMSPGDQVVHDLTGRRGILRECLQDGDAYVDFYDKSDGNVKWNHLTKVAP